MAQIAWSELKEARVGDTAPDMWFVVTEQDGSTVRNLTGFGAWVSFWYGGATGPHVVRAAPVDPVTGQIRYRLQGDEFTTAGMCYVQWTMKATDADSGSVARGHFRLSGQIVRRVVTA